jgi:hypothetical protein
MISQLFYVGPKQCLVQDSTLCYINHATSLLLSDFYQNLYSDCKFFVIDAAKDGRQSYPNKR